MKKLTLAELKELLLVKHVKTRVPLEKQDEVEGQDMVGDEKEKDIQF